MFTCCCSCGNSRCTSGMATLSSMEGPFLAWKETRSPATSLMSSIPAGSSLHGVRVYWYRTCEQHALIGLVPRVVPSSAPCPLWF